MTDSFFGLHNCHQNSSSSRILDYPLGRTAKEKELTSQITAQNLEKKKEKLDPSLDGKKRQRVSDDRSQFAELKQEKDGSSEGEAQKEDYVHVRAKKGRSTNSHNLAERARRKRIRERMKVLQDLVPGCSKITGKAVMLDEIINYVLSLQRQVNFLSMKMARVYPEMNAEQIVSGKIHHSQDHNAAILGDPVKAFSYPVSKENL